MSVIIRAVKPTDVADIFALIQAKAVFDGCPESLTLDEQQILEVFFSEAPKARAIIATLGDKVVGIATYYDIFSTFIGKPGLWLDDLYVYKAYRKYGIGKALLVELCNIARRNGCARIDWIVANDNDNGKGFYRSLGATIFEEIRHSRLDQDAINRLATS